MDNKEIVQTIPYVAHEAAMGRMENIIHRLFAVVILLIILLVGTNAGWIWWESQWTYETYQEVTQEAESGTNNFVGGDFYGETNRQDGKAQGS